MVSYPKDLLIFLKQKKSFHIICLLFFDDAFDELFIDIEISNNLFFSTVGF